MGYQYTYYEPIKSLPFPTLLFLFQGFSAQTTKSGDLVANIRAIINNFLGDSGDDYIPTTNNQLVD